jgi:hypothetical protein
MRQRRDPHSWTVGVGERNPSNASPVPAKPVYGRKYLLTDLSPAKSPHFSPR